MTKSKTTKRALLLSVISMLLCLSMLVGSTFAWFSDSVTSGKNRIVAGNLDVELMYKNAETAKSGDGWANAATAESVDPKFFVDKDGGEILWEPGVMAVTQFKVTNAGSLALRYELNTSNAGSNSLNDHDLSEIIKFAVVDGAHDYASRAEVEAASLTFNNFTDFKAEGRLLPAAKATEADPSEKIFTVVAYWAPTSNDNLYNVNNGQKTSDNTTQLYIDIEISLFATQVEYENDSFGNDYDKNAWIDEYGTENTDGTVELDGKLYVKDNGSYVEVQENTTTPGLFTAADGSGDKYVANAEALNAAAAAGGQVTLLGDITVEDSIQRTVTQDTTIDFNGYTLNGTIEGGSFLNADSPVNLVLSDPKNDGTKYTINGNIVVDPETHGMTQFAGIAVWKPTTTIESGRYTHDSAVINCQLQTNSEATGVVINGGTFDGKGAASVVADIIGTVIINDGTFNAYKDGDASGECVYLDFGDSKVPTITIINGGTFNAERRLFYIVPNAGYTQKLEVKGGTFTVAEGGSLVEVESGSAEGILVITGGTFNVDPSAYVPVTHQAQPNDDGTWTVTAISIDEAEEPDPFG